MVANGVSGIGGGCTGHTFTALEVLWMMALTRDTPFALALAMLWLILPRFTAAAATCADLLLLSTVAHMTSA